MEEDHAVALPSRGPGSKRRRSRRGKQSRAKHSLTYSRSLDALNHVLSWWETFGRPDKVDMAVLRDCLDRDRIARRSIIDGPVAAPAPRSTADTSYTVEDALEVIPGSLLEKFEIAAATDTDSESYPDSDDAVPFCIFPPGTFRPDPFAASRGQQRPQIQFLHVL